MLEDADKTRWKDRKKNRDEGCLTSRAYKRESGITVAVVGPAETPLAVSVDAITDRQITASSLLPHV